MATYRDGDRVKITHPAGGETLVAWVVRDAGVQSSRSGEALYEVEHRRGDRRSGRVIGGGVVPASQLQPYPYPVVSNGNGRSKTAKTAASKDTTDANNESSSGTTAEQ